MQSLILQSKFHLIVFYVALLVCFAPEWIGTFWQRSEREAKKHDRGSHIAIYVLVGVAMFAAFFLVNVVRSATISWHRHVLFWLGIGLMFAGLVIRWYSIRVLGKFFTRDVSTRPGQTVVDTGPYRLVRHPSYSGSLLMFLGTGLAMTNWASLLVLMLGAGVGFAYRVRVEEQVLCAELGEPYRAYMQRTRRFIPYIW